jgi:hypothetical protein
VQQGTDSLLHKFADRVQTLLLYFYVKDSSTEKQIRFVEKLTNLGGKA